MGLDMYLTKRIGIYAMYEFEKIDGTIFITKDGVQVPINFNKVSSISEQAAYWRKANAIHKWFVDHCQNGTDDCGEYEVTLDQLRELVKTCKAVLKDKDNVIYIDAVTGETKNYIISQDGEEVVFLNNERNEYISGSRYADEEHKIYLSDASVIKLYEEQTADTFTIFSANDFLEKAKAYVKDLTGADPGESYVALDDIGFALVTVNGSDGKLYFFKTSARPAGVKLKNSATLAAGPDSPKRLIVKISAFLA